MSESQYRIRMHASQSTKGIISFDCTIERTADEVDDPASGIVADHIRAAISAMEAKFTAAGYVVATIKEGTKI